MLIFAEYQQFTSDVVQNHNANTGHNLHNKSVPLDVGQRRQIDGQGQENGFEDAGCNAATNELQKLRADDAKGPLLAAKHIYLVGYICKNDHDRPGDGITCGCR